MPQLSQKRGKVARLLYSSSSGGGSRATDPEKSLSARWGEEREFFHNKSVFRKIEKCADDRTVILLAANWSFFYSHAAGTDDASLSLLGCPLSKCKSPTISFSCFLSSDPISLGAHEIFQRLHSSFLFCRPHCSWLLLFWPLFVVLSANKPNW